MCQVGMGGPGESRGGGLEHRTFFLSESTVRSGSVNKSVEPSSTVWDFGYLFNARFSIEETHGLGDATCVCFVWCYCTKK